MAKILGYSGVITGAGVTGITNCSIKTMSEAVETTVMGAGTKTFIPGLTSFTFDADGIGTTPALAEAYSVSEGNLVSFDVTGTAEAIDTTAFGDVGADDLPFKSFVAGLSEWSATLEMQFEGTLPTRGASYTFAGATGFIQDVSLTDPVNGIITHSVTIKGSGTLPTIVNTAGSTINFSFASDGADIVAGAAIVTSSKVSGAIGGLITYAISSQGTGELSVTQAGA